MEDTIKSSITTFLDNLHLNSHTLTASQHLLDQQLAFLTGEVENLSATSHLPTSKLEIINSKIEKIPQLQLRIDSAAKKLL